MKKVIITSIAVATLLTVVLVALHDAETALTVLLMPVLIGLIALLICGILKGISEIKSEIKFRKELKKQ
jgi:hypothetical protein